MGEEVELCVEIGSNMNEPWVEKANINELCRACANTHANMIPIFEGDGLEHDLKAKIDKHFPVTISKNDGLPHRMCFQCASTLVAWHDMFTGCIDAEKKLKNLLKISKEDSKVVEEALESSVSAHGDLATEKLKLEQNISVEMDVEDGDDDDDDDDDDHHDDDEEEDAEEDEIESEEVVLHKLDGKKKENAVEIGDKETTIRDQDSLGNQMTTYQKDSTPENQNCSDSALRNRKCVMNDKQLEMKNVILRTNRSIKDTSTSDELSVEYGSDEENGDYFNENQSVDLDESVLIQVSHKPISISVVNGMFRITVIGFEVDKNFSNINSIPTFKCCICLENTDSANIASHCKLHGFLKVTDMCKFCSIEMSVEELEEHLTNHRIFLEPVICENLKQFTTGMQTHLQKPIPDSVVGKIPVFKCHKCSKLFPAENDLESHVENRKCIEPKISEENLLERHKSKKQFSISYKPVEVFRKQDNSYRVAIRGFLLCSNEVDEDPVIFRCCLCLENMKPANLVSHIKSHNPLRTSDECKICCTKFDSINELKKHLNGHNYFLSGLNCQNLDEFENKCSSQNKKLVPGTEQNVDNSMVKTEEVECEIPIFKCEDCSKILLDYKDLECHKNEHKIEEMCSDDISVSTSKPYLRTSKPAYKILLDPGNSDEIKVVVNGFTVRNEHYDIIPILSGDNEEFVLHPKHACCLCLEDVSSVNLASHWDTLYPLRSSDSCQVCSLDFENTIILEKHLFDHKFVLDALICKSMDEFNAKLAELSSKDTLHQLSGASNDIGEDRSSIPEYIPGYKCDVCEKIFLIESKFERHIKSSACISFVQPIHFLKESDKGMELAIHGYSSDSKSDNAVDKPNPYVCCICLDVLGCKNSILQHYKLHYPLKSTDTCKLCSFNCDSVPILELHMSEHSVLLDVMDLAASIESQVEEQSSGIPILNPDCENTLKCIVCEGGFVDECMFKKHIESGKCIKFKRFACRKCGKNFNRNTQLYEHMKVHSNIYSLCHICGANVKKVGMRRHIRAMHERLEATQRKYDVIKKTCHVCGVSVSKYTFDQHFATHSFSRNYSCGLCKKTFSHKLSYKGHLKIHASTERKGYSCEICSETFRRRDYLVTHKAKRHNIVKQKDHKCDMCTREFSTANSLLLHKRTHLESQNYQCVECKAIFSSGMGLKNHQTQTRHHGVQLYSSSIDDRDKVNRYVCQICDQRYGSLASLKRHENFHYDANENESEESSSAYECPECHRNYSSLRSLELHIIRTNHAVERTRWKRKRQPENESTSVKKQFLCQQCDSIFPNRFSLKAHRRKLKHFLVCSLCNDSTVVDSDEHNKEKHTDNNKNGCAVKFKCAECPKQFKKLKMLDNHIALKHNKEQDVSAIQSGSQFESSPQMIVNAVKTICLPDDEFIGS